MKKLDQIHLRVPGRTDGPALFQLAGACAPLEPNSEYAYFLIASHFSATSIIAEDSVGPVGFVAGYRLPDHPSTWFVWQVGVHERARGLGLGRAMLAEILARPTFTPVAFLETTISPSNVASRRLFAGFARQAAAPLVEEAFLEAEHFHGTHEAERLFRIGPFRRVPANP